MADEKYLSTLSGPELDAALRAATTVTATVRSELQIAKDSGEFDGPQGIQGLQGPMGTLGQAGQIQDFDSAAAVAGPSFNYYANFSTPLIEGINGSKICGVTTLPAGYWTYQIFLLGNADSPSMLMRRIDTESGNVAEELEWVNPPMDEVDVEYRTIERFCGKPVYKRHFSLTDVTGVWSQHLDTDGTYKIINVQGYDHNGALIGGKTHPVDTELSTVTIDFGSLQYDVEIEVSYIKP